MYPEHLARWQQCQWHTNVATHQTEPSQKGTKFGTRTREGTGVWHSGFVCSSSFLAARSALPYMSYNIFQLEIILLKVIRLFSLRGQYDDGRQRGLLPFPIRGQVQKVEPVEGRTQRRRLVEEKKIYGMRVGQIKAKCTKMFGNSFDFDSSPKVNGNIFVDFSVYFCNVFVVVVCFLMNCVLQLKICCWQSCHTRMMHVVYAGGKLWD